MRIIFNDTPKIQWRTWMPRWKKTKKIPGLPSQTDSKSTIDCAKCRINICRKHIPTLSCEGK